MKIATIIIAAIWLLSFVFAFGLSMYMYYKDKHRPVSVFWSEEQARDVKPIWFRFLVAFFAAPIAAIVALEQIKKIRTDAICGVLYGINRKTK